MEITTNEDRDYDPDDEMEFEVLREVWLTPEDMVVMTVHPADNDDEYDACCLLF